LGDAFRFLAKLLYLCSRCFQISISSSSSLLLRGFLTNTDRETERERERERKKKEEEEEMTTKLLKNMKRGKRKPPTS
jgi:hypothetical protein